jgi:hypothetical protein
MSTTQVFAQGESIPIWCEVTNWEGSHVDPTAGLTIDVYRDTTKVVDAVAMTQDDTGVYVYYYQSASDEDTGWLRWVCTAVDGSGVNAKTVIDQGGFWLR